MENKENIVVAESVQTENNVKEQVKKDKKKEYTPNRFEFTLYINDFVICRRNFKINYFNEQSFYSTQMMNQFENIVTMVQEDLKSKSRLYTWYYYDENVEDDEFSRPLIEPWVCTFKLSITDDGKEMFSKIWDGRYYPRTIREHIDLTNKYIYYNDIRKDIASIENPEKLPIEGYISKIIYGNREDLVIKIIKMICEVSSPQEITVLENGSVIKGGDYADEQDYETSDIFYTREGSKITDRKKYIYSRYQRYMKLCSDLGAWCSDKTKRYFEVECNNMFNN